MRQTLIILLLIFALAGCKHRLTDKDLSVTGRLFSPDSSYVVLTCHIDVGAMGDGATFISIVKCNDSTGDVYKNHLPRYDFHSSFYGIYSPDRWIDNKTLQFVLDDRAFVKAGLPFYSSNFLINGITCKVIRPDHSDNVVPLIDYFCFSADRKKILVVYRYVRKYTREFNVSVIGYGNNLPRFGNLLTIYGSFNPIEFVQWNGNAIDMFLRQASEFSQSNYINKGLAYKINFVDIEELKSVKQNEVEFISYPLYQDVQMDSLLMATGITIHAIITENRWSKVDDKSQVDYQYEYTAGGEKYGSFFKIYTNFKDWPTYKTGDSIEVKYDPKQPFIHKIIKGYSR